MTVRADLIRDKRRTFAAPGSSHDRMVGLLNKVLPAGVGIDAPGVGAVGQLWSGEHGPEKGRGAGR